MQVANQQFLHVQRKDFFHLIPTLTGKQVGQVIGIAILGGHGDGDVTDIDVKKHRYERWPLGHFVLRTPEAAALPFASFKDEAAVWNNVDDEAGQVSIRDGLQ